MLTFGSLPTKGMELKEFSWIWFGINHFSHSERGDRGSCIKHPQTLDTKGIEPRQFCRIWCGVNCLSPTEIAGHQVQTGDRGSCIKQTQTLDTKKPGSISLATNFAYALPGSI